MAEQERDVERTEIEALLETRRELGPQCDAVGLVGLLVGWSGLVGINIAHALQSRPPR